MDAPHHKQFPSLLGVCALTLVSLAPLSTIGAETLHRLPATNPSDVQANLARRFLGAEILSARTGDHGIGLLPYERSILFTDPNRQLTALLCDDSTIGSPIAQGTSEVVIRLHSVHDINRVAFVKRGGAGRISIHGCESEDAMQNNQWVALGYSLLEEGRDAVTVNFGAASARYVRLSFEAVTPITIYNFGIFGLATLADYHLESGVGQPSGFGGAPRPISISAPFTSHDFSLLSVAAGANLIYESPAVGNTDFSNNSDSSNHIKFRQPAASNVLIYEFPSWAPPRDSLGISYSAPTSQRIQVYFLERLPEQENWLGNRTLDTSFFDELTPSIDTVDVDQIGRFSSDLASTSSRYVAVRLSPSQANASRLRSFLLPLANIGNPSAPLVINVGAFSSEIGSSDPYRGGKSAKSAFPSDSPYFAEAGESSRFFNPMADFSCNLYDGRGVFRGLGLPRDGLFEERLPDALQVVSP